MVFDLIDLEKKQRDPDDQKDGDIEYLFLFDRSIDLVLIGGCTLDYSNANLIDL